MTHVSLLESCVCVCIFRSLTSIWRHQKKKEEKRDARVCGSCAATFIHEASERRRGEGLCIGSAAVPPLLARTVTHHEHRLEHGRGGITEDKSSTLWRSKRQETNAGVIQEASRSGKQKVRKTPHNGGVVAKPTEIREGRVFDCSPHRRKGADTRTHARTHPHMHATATPARPDSGSAQTHECR